MIILHLPNGLVLDSIRFPFLPIHLYRVIDGASAAPYLMMRIDFTSPYEARR